MARWNTGQSGNPHGRPKKGQTLTEQFERLLEETGEDGQPNKRRFAEAVFDLAVGGNAAAASLILSYVDGKPAQQVDLTSNGETFKAYIGVDTDRV